MKRSRRGFFLATTALLLILVLAAGIRFYKLGNQSLWADEGNSVALAARPLSQINQAAANDIHPPLYYWLLRAWTRMTGTTERGVRSFSVLIGVLLVWTVAELGRRLYDDATGLAAAFIAALAPFQIYYSQETRMYILLALEATLAMLVFCWFISQEDRQLPAGTSETPRTIRLLPFSGRMLTLAWVAGLYTHYAFPLVIALLTGIYALWVWHTRKRGLVRRRLVRWGVLLALTLGFYAPWLPTALRQLTSWPTGGVHTGIAEGLKGCLTMLHLGPIGRAQPGTWWLWLLVGLALLGALPGRTGRRRSRWFSSLLLLSWSVAPIGMMLVFGLYRDAYLKFLLIASPAYCLLLARGILAPISELQFVEDTTAAAESVTEAAAGAGQLPSSDLIQPWMRNPLSAFGRSTRRWRIGSLGILAAIWTVGALGLVSGLSGATLTRYFSDPAFARDDYRGMVQFILATAQPNDAILLNAPGQEEVFRYYYQGELPVYALPRQRPLDRVDTLAELEKLYDHDKIYALFWAEAEADPERLILRWINSRGYKTLDQWRGNVRFAVYVMPEQKPPEEIVDDLNLSLGNDIELVGYRGWKLNPTAGEVTQLQLIWRAKQAPERRYKVFVQLLDPRDQVIAQRDSEPVGGSQPTSEWKAGELIGDNHGLLIPPGTPPGSYRRILGMYDMETLERLKLPSGEDFVSLPPVTVKRLITPPFLAAFDMMYGQQFDFGGISLLGHDRYKRGFGHAPATPIRAGELLHLTFYWQANIAPRADWWFDLTLSDNRGNTVASYQAPLVGETYSTMLWAPTEIVRGEHDLLIPPDLPPGAYRLSLIMLPDTNTHAGTAYLGTVKVSP